MQISTGLDVTLHGDGPRCVVLAHGFGTDQSAWEYQVPSLVRAGYRVLTYDAAGATPATTPLFRPKRHGTLYGFAEDLIAVISEQGFDRVSFVGHSAAGMAGVLAAQAAPGLFRQLILIGGSARYIDDPPSGYVGGFTASQVDALLAAMADNYTAWANGFAPVVAPDLRRPELAHEFAASLLALRADVAVATLTSILRSDHRAEATRNRLPVRVLQTARDAAVPWEAAAWLAHALHAPEPIVVDTEGHFPHRSAPYAVNTALLVALADAS